MMDAKKPYGMTMGVSDDMLAEMAGIIGAEYVRGSFDALVDAHFDNEEPDYDWELRGAYGVFRVFIERWESYLHCSLRAEEPYFQAGKQVLWDRAMRAGAKLPARMNPYL